ncbi:MAG: mannonate dehydratase [Synergistaceae bacterium]|jgi:mannonate dehydratase|nr:mannonate dehydratase [Synergistaceae bacterium]
MILSFRWYGDDDPVTLDAIRQIPVVKGIVSALYDVPVGEVWPLEKLQALKNAVEAKGFKLSAIESIPVHEHIKLGLRDADKLMGNYCRSVLNMGKAGISVLCYNFMPVFDWTRSSLALELPDGSNCLSHDDAEIRDMDLSKGTKGLPGWSAGYDADQLRWLLDAYRDLNAEGLWSNLERFLKKVVPAAQEADVKMGIHPDDPPWPIFGLPRIICGEASLDRFLKIADVPHNGLSLCTGSLGVLPENDIPKMVRKYSALGRVHFAHVRNVKIGGPHNFNETAHPTECGSLDIASIVRAYAETGFQGVMRPDHGRMIWGETGRPGYGLYDRALGAMYLAGLWEAFTAARP